VEMGEVESGSGPGLAEVGSDTGAREPGGRVNVGKVSDPLGRYLGR
jgi:hypothetical protein